MNLEKSIRFRNCREEKNKSGYSRYLRDGVGFAYNSSEVLLNPNLPAFPEFSAIKLEGKSTFDVDQESNPIFAQHLRAVIEFVGNTTVNLNELENHVPEVHPSAFLTSSLSVQCSSKRFAKICAESTQIGRRGRRILLS